jgi:hypothetical protein
VTPSYIQTTSRRCPSQIFGAQPINSELYQTLRTERPELRDFLQLRSNLNVIAMDSCDQLCNLVLFPHPANDHPRKNCVDLDELVMPVNVGDNIFDPIEQRLAGAMKKCAVPHLT